MTIVLGPVERKYMQERGMSEEEVIAEIEDALASHEHATVTRMRDETERLGRLVALVFSKNGELPMFADGKTNFDWVGSDHILKLNYIKQLEKDLNI